MFLGCVEMDTASIGQKRKKKSRLESVFQNEMRRSFLHFYPKCFYYKIPDGIRMGDWSSFIPPKPFDAFCSIDRINLAIEYKVHKVHTAWSLSALTESQLEGLESADKNAFYGFVLLNVRHGLGKVRVDKVYIIHISSVKRLMKNGVKSIKFDDLEKYKQLKKIKLTDDTVGWDVRELISCMVVN